MTSAGRERVVDIGGLQTTIVGEPSASLALVMLHGYSMRPEDLTPFAHSIGIPALFLLPQGPVVSPLGGRAWWSVDLESREAALSLGPRDLADDYPSGLAAARQQLQTFLDAVSSEFQPRRLVVGGFSQGGMLSLDWVLRGARPPDALALLSASRIATREWQPHLNRLQGLPVFISHGTADQDLDFAAGERLGDLVLEAGARVFWVPFDGGHEIPLVVWRGLRKFLRALLE